MTPKPPRLLLTDIGDSVYALRDARYAIDKAIKTLEDCKSVALIAEGG